MFMPKATNTTLKFQGCATCNRRVRSDSNLKQRRERRISFSICHLALHHEQTALPLNSPSAAELMITETSHAAPLQYLVELRRRSSRAHHGGSWHSIDR
jgi:hypothetical protein